MQVGLPSSVRPALDGGGSGRCCCRPQLAGWPATPASSWDSCQGEREQSLCKPGVTERPRALPPVSPSPGRHSSLLSCPGPRVRAMSTPLRTPGMGGAGLQSGTQCPDPVLVQDDWRLELLASQVHLQTLEMSQMSISCPQAGPPFSLELGRDFQGQGSHATSRPQASRTTPPPALGQVQARAYPGGQHSLPKACPPAAPRTSKGFTSPHASWELLCNRRAHSPVGKARPSCDFLPTRPPLPRAPSSAHAAQTREHPQKPGQPGGSHLSTVGHQRRDLADGRGLSAAGQVEGSPLSASAGAGVGPGARPQRRPSQG